MRIQFEIPEERVKEIDTLIDKLGLNTRVQLLNAALTFFEWGIRQREQGNIIASLNEEEGTYKELEMAELSLPAIKQGTTWSRANRLPDEQAPQSKELINAIAKATDVNQKIMLEAQALLYLGEIEKQQHNFHEAKGYFNKLLDLTNHWNTTEVENIIEMFSNFVHSDYEDRLTKLTAKLANDTSDEERDESLSQETMHKEPGSTKEE